MILSDANTVFIDEFLAYHGIRDLFSEVATNPAEFDSNGRLHVRPHHEGAPHSSPICPPNLCKGSVLAKVRSSLPSEVRVIYVGDGGGDFCPACELRPGDAVLCRAPPSPPLQNFGLHSPIEKLRAGRAYQGRDGNPVELKAEVFFWSSGAEVAAIFETLLARDSWHGCA